MKTLIAWSSGKDSAMTLHALRQSEDVKVVGLLTTVNSFAARVSMHAVRESLLEAQAASCGLPLLKIPLPDPCSDEAYQTAMAAVIGQARKNGVEAIAFGDLFLTDVRAYRESRLAGTGIKSLFPLWGRGTSELAQEVIDIGMGAVLTCVDPRQLDPVFVGRSYDRSLLADLPASVDPCGENGEFHTFVIDGPMFLRSVAVRSGEVVERDGFVFADLVPA